MMLYRKEERMRYMNTYIFPSNDLCTARAVHIAHSVQPSRHCAVLCRSFVDVEYDIKQPCTTIMALECLVTQRIFIRGVYSTCCSDGVSICDKSIVY
jgi:hypothetical protein